MDPHCFIVQVVYLVVGKVFEEQSHRVGDKSQRTPSDDQVGGRALSHLWTKTVGFSEKKIHHGLLVVIFPWKTSLRDPYRGSSAFPWILPVTGAPLLG